MKKKVNIQKTIVSALESGNQEWKTRIISGVAILVCATIILMETVGRLNSANQKTASDFIFLALLIVQFLFPRTSVMLGLITIFAGLINVYYNGHILGLLLYAFGLSLLMREGFFRRNKRIKLPLVFLAFFGALLLQYGRNPNKLYISFANLIIATGIICAFVFMFHDNLKVFYSLRPPIKIDEYDLSPRQIACIAGCRDNKTIREIASAEFVSDSVIKKEFLAVYKTFGVSDRHELENLLKDREIIFGLPDSATATEADAT